MTSKIEMMTVSRGNRNVLLGQVIVLARNLATPPGSPAQRARYIVAASPTGAWVGHANHIAEWYDGEWLFFTPTEGVMAYDVGAHQHVFFNQSAAWAVL